MFVLGIQRRLLPKNVHGFFIFNWNLVETESRILKQSSEQRERQFSEIKNVLIG